MNDIIPPKRPLNQAQRPSEARPTAPEPAPEPQAEPQTSPKKARKGKSWLKWLLIALAGLLLVAAVAAACIWTWYNDQLKSVSPDSKEYVVVTVESGSSPETIGELLKEKDLIRNQQAFEWYIRLNDAAGQLQTGAYKIARSADVPAIVEKITSGDVDMITVTFIPGQTLAEHRQKLIEAGFNESELDAALSKEYDHPLLKGKPAVRDLEGYLYPETYQFGVDATPEQVVRHTFDIYYQAIEQDGLEAKFKKRGLSLFEGITLASIIEKEAANAGEMPQISQVFHLRLKRDMPLGSDPTYQYIADKTGQTRDPALQSPYNTRIVTGLPPGPIASPGLSALQAAATPAQGDYLYFVHGDDNKIYMAHTNEEHEANVRKHCQQKCQIL